MITLAKKTIKPTRKECLEFIEIKIIIVIFIVIISYISLGEAAGFFYCTVCVLMPFHWGLTMYDLCSRDVHTLTQTQAHTRTYTHTHTKVIPALSLSSMESSERLLLFKRLIPQW